MGIYKPSICISVASGPTPNPPISVRWDVQENKPTIFLSLKQGVVITKSLRWPVPIQGSLVINISPSFIELRGKCSIKCLTDSAIEFTCPGVPVTA